MNLELILALATSAGALVLAFLYARASKGASLADQWKLLFELADEETKLAHDVIADKEAQIREAEKILVSGLSAPELVSRLNRVFPTRS